jgi:hypothetical protein
MLELAVIVPTRGRPDNILKVIGAWDFTNAWDVADLVLVADADDPEIGGYRDIAQMDTIPIRLVEVSEWRPMVHKLNEVATALAEEGRYFALGFAGDDHLPQTINWAKTYLAQLHELGTGMVYGDDGYQGVKLSTEWAVTSDAVKALGRMVPAPVEHMYCDNAMMDLFKEAGALRHLPQVRIEHMHPIVKKAPTDAQYQRVNHRDQFRKDRASYEGWRRSGMAADVAAVRALRGGRDEERPTIRPVVERPPAPRYTGPMRSGPTNRRITEMRRNQFPFSRDFVHVQGATPDEIGMTLADFATGVPADQEIVELGVFRGRTALIMAWGATQGNGAHVTGFDPWDSEGNVYDPPFTDSESRIWAEYRIGELGYADRIALVQEFSVVAAERWAAGIEATDSDHDGHASDPGVFSGAIPWAKPVGLLFVDGDHTKEGARADIEAWAPNLAEGAIIAVDDYHHPDWPGVAEAVDELVAEGVLEPVEVFHDRLAVTRLTERQEWATKGLAAQPITAITSEGVTPSPYPAAPDQVAVTEQVGPATVTTVVPHTEATLVREVEEVLLPEVDTQESFQEPPLRTTVHEGELEGVAEGTPVQELTLPQIKTLAKVRGITLGIRKDKKADAIQALVDGR